MKTAVVAVLALLALGGCRPWAEIKDQQLSIKAPEKVSRRENFVFTVTATDRYNDPVSVAYQYQIQWVGIGTSMRNGHSGSPESVAVKGAAGKAMLRIFGYDRHDAWTEIASCAFDVE